ncbi:enoyl-CoA hydratase [Sinorhizobium sp. A49]|uniref:MaoC family dehydratase n=1 Tax=Sinorhizobium sp. A49 TaxID=1945861 RepID=UPI0009860527|nr:MaoC family dehydratase [Sinorhizobium sp. A49]OOG67903.1 enoyl-CoA hydratase [Sinorhizobium sp. A49]
MLYFEDFSEGRRFDYKPVEMKPSDMIAFAQEFDPQPMHLDEEAGNRSILGGLSASGWHTSAVGMRMMLDAFMGQSTSQGSPGIDFMDWKKPVLAGDVLTGFSQVLEARRSKSKPGLGIVKFRNEIVNQVGEPVAVSECSVLFRCRDKVQH